MSLWNFHKLFIALSLYEGSEIMLHFNKGSCSWYRNLFFVISDILNINFFRLNFIVPCNLCCNNLSCSSPEQLAIYNHVPQYRTRPQWLGVRPQNTTVHLYNPYMFINIKHINLFITLSKFVSLLNKRSVNNKDFVFILSCKKSVKLQSTFVN